MLDIKKVSKEILYNKINNRFPVDDIDHEFKLLKGEIDEVGEVLNDPEKLAKELADVTIFVISIARMQNIDLEKAILEKIEFNKTRTYKKGTFRVKETTG